MCALYGDKFKKIHSAVKSRRYLSELGEKERSESHLQQLNFDS